MSDDEKLILVDDLVTFYSRFEETDLLTVLENLLMEKSTKELRQLYIDEGIDD